MSIFVHNNSYTHMKVIYRSIIIIISVILIAPTSYAHNNSLGNITVEFADSIIPENLRITAITSSIFDEPFENTEHKFSQDGNIFFCQIPLETKKNLIGLIVETPEQKFSIGFVELLPGMRLKMEGSFTPNGILKYNKSDYSGFNLYPLDSSDNNKSLTVIDIITRFTSYHLGLTDKEPQITANDYKSWKVFNEKMDSLYSVQLNYALNGRPIPEVAAGWLENNLRYFFDANWRMNYKERANRTFNITQSIDNFPIEYYSFLNNIDFSDSFLNHSIYFGPYYLLKKILMIPGFLDAIGNQSIDEWQSTAKSKLSTIISNPSHLLLELLTATSYIMQLNDKNHILTAQQIENIKTHLNKDLGDIILARNTLLCKQLSNKSDILDLSSSCFSLDKFIDENYPGYPIIVDFWNTWCGPCLKAHKETENIISKTPDTIFLYISDTSSFFEEWNNLAKRIGGVQIRISQNNMEKLCKLYNLNGFPSYIIFNKKHDIVYKQTGYQGLNEYLKWLNLSKQ